MGGNYADLQGTGSLVALFSMWAHKQARRAPLQGRKKTANYPGPVFFRGGLVWLCLSRFTEHDGLLSSALKL